ncbi:hypothetical protein Psch_02601 [Pelotomaculum schinkii]|uniref:Uncharacterized protein n=1 Tax=Pelotomaculum schinkii TaxID=78350 RepID=A0A4Y7RA81_9FIRM|nr:DUF6179 domain-containing protein [Pelotomaculum schinkii]TEB05560.1 hypothetical protein Psch_02601 [Pelotomaculum schinkii]
MENRSLIQIKNNQIKTENIDYHQLTLSLLNEGLRTKMLTGAQVEQIQAQIIAMLGEAISQYTKYESSSVRTETAQGILQSLLYSIDYYLMKLSSLEQSIEAIQQINIVEIYKQGLELVKCDLELAQNLLQEVQNTRLPVSIIAYNDTINQGLGEFFQSYDVKFDAQNTAASIDYPLLFDDFGWTGINYIKRYLEHLKLENELCSHFNPEDINLLLEGYGRQYGLDCTQPLINISELILKNALCLVLSGRRADILTINQDDCDLLESRMQMLTEEQFPEMLQGAMNTVFTQLDITNPAVQQYFQPFTDVFCPQLIKAVKENSLSVLIVLTIETFTSSTLYYEPGEKLSDEQLRAVIDKLMECQDGEGKADIIEREIHNIEDLTDVFGADCIFGHEYTAIFKRMGDYELAILSSFLLNDSPLSNDKVLSTDHLHRTENELYWQEKLIRYLEAGDINRYKNIVQLAVELRQQY